MSVRAMVHSPPGSGSTTAMRSSRSKLDDPPRHALVQVDGAGVDELGGPGRVDGADEAAVAARTMRTSPADAAAQADAVGGEPRRGPHRRSARRRPGAGP